MVIEILTTPLHRQQRFHEASITSKLDTVVFQEEEVSAEDHQEVHEEKRLRRVSLGKVYIHEYERALDYKQHPQVPASLSLGWKYQDSDEFAITEPSCPTRRICRCLQPSTMGRLELLFAWGYTEHEILHVETKRLHKCEGKVSVNRLYKSMKKQVKSMTRWYDSGNDKVAPHGTKSYLG